MLKTLRPFLLGAVLLLAAGMGGCSSTTTARIQDAAVAACTLYAASLESMAALIDQHRVSAAQVATMNEVRAVADPLCTAATPAEGVAATIMTQVARLARVNTDAMKTPVPARAPAGAR